VLLYSAGQLPICLLMLASLCLAMLPTAATEKRLFKNVCTKKWEKNAVRWPKQNPKKETGKFVSTGGVALVFLLLLLHHLLHPHFP